MLHWKTSTTFQGSWVGPCLIYRGWDSLDAGCDSWFRTFHLHVTLRCSAVTSSCVCFSQHVTFNMHEPATAGASKAPIISIVGVRTRRLNLVFIYSSTAIACLTPKPCWWRQTCKHLLLSFIYHNSLKPNDKKKQRIPIIEKPEPWIVWFLLDKLLKLIIKSHDLTWVWLAWLTHETDYSKELDFFNINISIFLGGYWGRNGWFLEQCAQTWQPTGTQQINRGQFTRQLSWRGQKDNKI